ncbi:hypothetical protein [Geodermatophilus chilensis]|jgi:hypothetical protein|uniref:hypothetical protein n=1 Tax=Geodermatophilus chilensis TaxID=2035835 RepID=UPI000C268A26|nr:hypothetical protein [Geodermatophilus chilensis]
MISDYFLDQLAADFARARLDVLEARLREEQDTPAHRTAVAHCRPRVDAVLDRYLKHLKAKAHGVGCPR